MGGRRRDHVAKRSFRIFRIHSTIPAHLIPATSLREAAIQVEEQGRGEHPSSRSVAPRR